MLGTDRGCQMLTLDNYTLPTPVDHEAYLKQIAEKDSRKAELLKKVAECDAKITNAVAELTKNFDLTERQAETFHIDKEHQINLKQTWLQEIQLNTGLKDNILSAYEKALKEEKNSIERVRIDWREFRLALSGGESIQMDLKEKISSAKEFSEVCKKRAELKDLVGKIEQLKSLITKIETYLDSVKTVGNKNSIPMSEPAPNQMQIKLTKFSEEEMKDNWKKKVPIQIISSKYDSDLDAFNFRIKTLGASYTLYAVALDGCFQSLPARVILEIMAIPTSKLSSDDTLDCSVLIDRKQWNQSGHFYIDIHADTFEKKQQIIATF